MSFTLWHLLAESFDNFYFYFYLFVCVCVCVWSLLIGRDKRAGFCIYSRFWDSHDFDWSKNFTLKIIINKSING